MVPPHFTLAQREPRSPITGTPVAAYSDTLSVRCLQECIRRPACAVLHRPTALFAKTKRLLFSAQTHLDIPILSYSSLKIKMFLTFFHTVRHIFLREKGQGARPCPYCINIFAKDEDKIPPRGKAFRRGYARYAREWWRAPRSRDPSPRSDKRDPIFCRSGGCRSIAS